MRVSMFVTCMVDSLFPQVGEAMVRVLERLGVEVDVPKEQTCCGQPAWNSGHVEEAKVVGKTLVQAFNKSEYVVSPSGSCTGMIKHFFPQIYENEFKMAEDALHLATHTYEFSQFLVNVLGVTDLGAVFPHKVTYHPSCHASRLLGVKDEPLLLLERVAQIELLDLPRAEDCCGFGGTFSVKMPELSTAMADEKVAHVAHTGADVLVSTDMGCLMHIGGRMGRLGNGTRVMHIAELLDEGMTR